MNSETLLTNKVRLQAADNGIYLWRNNRGAAYTKDGRLVRYGLANESAKLNKVLKSHDLIGATPTLITQDMVGKTLAVFTSYEIKTGGAVDPAQQAWLELIVRLGGISKIIRSEADFYDL